MFKLFSRRRKESLGEIDDVYVYDTFPVEFRNQAFHIISDVFDEMDKKERVFSSENEQSIWNIICRLYAREKGLKYLIDRRGYKNQKRSFECYIDESSDEDFLDLLDFSVIQVICNESVIEYFDKTMFDEAIEEINNRFEQHSLGYEVTGGKIVVKTNRHAHKNIVKPAMLFLHDKEFSGAEEEFFKAFDFLKQKDYKNSIAEAAKSFESVLKIICKGMGYSFDNEKDTAKKLVEILKKNKFFPSYLDCQMSTVCNLLESGVPTIRNKTSGHGQGAEKVFVSMEYAEYAINLVASNIIFLVKLYQNNK